MGSSNSPDWTNYFQLQLNMNNNINKYTFCCRRVLRVVTSASKPIALAISAYRDNSEYLRLYDCTLCGVMTTLQHLQLLLLVFTSLLQTSQLHVKSDFWSMIASVKDGIVTILSLVGIVPWQLLSTSIKWWKLGESMGMKNQKMGVWEWESGTGSMGVGLWEWGYIYIKGVSHCVCNISLLRISGADTTGKWVPLRVFLLHCSVSTPAVVSPCHVVLLASVTENKQILTLLDWTMVTTPSFVTLLTSRAWVWSCNSVSRVATCANHHDNQQC